MKTKLFKISFILFLSVIVFFGFSFAGGDISTNTLTSEESLLSSLSKFLSYLYLIFWPFLYLGGKFLSNDFVYGNAFGIDNILWQLWQFVRTFMNYFLGILLITSIFIYLIKDNSKLSIKVLFPKLLLASLVVNASWFLFAVLIDISSILLVTASSFASEFNKTLSSKTEINKKNIMVPVVIDISSSSGFIYIKGNNQSYYQCIYDKDNKIKNAPCFYIKDGDYKIVDNSGKEIENAIRGIKVDNLESSAGMLYSLFRYLNSSFLIDNTNSVGSNFVLIIMKIIIWIILLLPFILLVVILFIRVLVLWVAIPLSPILFGFTILGIGDSKSKEQFKKVLTLIFQPAYIVFMLSLGFIFIQAVYIMYPKDSGKDNLLGKLGFEFKSKENNSLVEKNLNYKDIISISSEYNKKNGENSSNIDFKNIFSFFSWFIVNLLSALILWVLVFTALKSSKITSGMVNSVESFAKQAVKSVPILPAGQSIGSVEKSLSYLMSVPSQISDKQKTDLVKSFTEVGKNDTKKDDK